MSDKKKIGLAVVASLLVHVLLILVFAFGTWILPEREKALAMQAQTYRPTEINVVELAPDVLKTQEPGILDTTGLTATEAAPENPLFESDINSKAGSDAPATGDAPAPSQEGKDRPGAEFVDSPLSLGPTDRPAAPPVLNIASLDLPKPEPERKPKPERKLLEQEPTPTPTYEGEPLLQDAEATPTPTPRPEATQQSERDGFARPTPRPVVKASATPKLRATPTVTPTAAPRSTPAPTLSPEDLAMFMPTPRPRKAPRAKPVLPGYQPHKQRNRIEGNLSNRGPRGVDAIGTPLGRYQKVIRDAVGSRWYFYINRRMDMMTVGTVRIRFFVNDKGKVEDVRMLSNTGNDTFAGFSIQSILDAEIPPPPSDVVEVLDDNRLEIVYTFTLYPN